VVQPEAPRFGQAEAQDPMELMQEKIDFKAKIFKKTGRKTV